MNYFLFLLACLPGLAAAQSKLSGQVRDARGAQFISINIPYTCYYTSDATMTIKTDDKGMFSTSLIIDKPRNIYFEHGKRRMLLYLEPGKDLTLEFDSANLENSVVFKGDLQTENQFRRKTGISFFTLQSCDWKDSLAAPKAIIDCLERSQQDALVRLKNLNKNVSPAFRAITKADLEYFPAYAFWDIIFNNRRGGEDFNDVLKDAYQPQRLTDSTALDSYYYQYMITYYPHFLMKSAADKASFEKLVETIFKKPYTKAENDIKEKGKRLWEYKALHYGLTGIALEQAAAACIDSWVHNGEFEYLEDAYIDFSERFPNSVYRPHLDRIMKTYFSKTRANKNVNIVFEPTETIYRSLEHFLEKHKGRVVYIDLWGTWCPPCREEFRFNASLKTYFFGEPVDFVYVAFEHMDRNPNFEQIWKKTVLHYDLAGRHILASRSLRKILEDLYAPGGMDTFPRYILINKQGIVTDRFADAPSSKKKLYRKIERLLKENKS